MIEFKDPVAEHIKAFILDETALQIDNREMFQSDPVWQEIHEQGSRIWLQGCDRIAAEIWSADMDAFLLDMPQMVKTLRRKEYAALIGEANSFLKGLPRPERIKEIIFIINARHAVQVSKQFAASVSVEVPLLPGGVEEIEQYGRRLYQVCPEHLIITLPYSTYGIRAAIGLGKQGIPVTITNVYSIEQIVDSVRTSAPSYIAVSLETAARTLSSSAPAGETVTLARRILNYFSGNPDSLGNTVLIAEGLSDSREIRRLQGFPVLSVTSPAARKYCSRRFSEEGVQAPGPKSFEQRDLLNGTPESPGKTIRKRTGMGHRLARRGELHRREEYNRLFQIINQTIDSN